MHRASRGRRRKNTQDTYDLETVHGRLAFARSQKYPSASAAARAHGWVVSTTSQHENGDRNLTADFAIKYAEAYDVSLDYLYFGKTPLQLTSNGLQPLAKQFIPELDLNNIDALRKYGMEKIAMSDRRLPIPPDEDGPNQSKIFIRMQDSSMESEKSKQTICKGDLLECDASEPPTPGNVVLALVSALPHGIIRRYRQISLEPSIIELIPLNSSFPVITLSDSNQGQIIARVTRRITKL